MFCVLHIGNAYRPYVDQVYEHQHQHIDTSPIPGSLNTNLPLCCGCQEVTPGIPGCQADSECEFIVCLQDEYCCGAQWELQCVTKFATPICNANTLSPTRTPTLNPTPTPIVATDKSSLYWLNEGIV